MMFAFGPAKVLYFDSSIYCLGEGKAETDLATLRVGTDEYRARVVVDVKTPIEIMTAVRDPYEATRIPLRVALQVSIVDSEGAIRYSGALEANGTGYIVLRANELAALEFEHPVEMRATTGQGTFHPRFSGRIAGTDPAGYPEFEIGLSDAA
jgi:hypothetical protein